MFVLRFLSNLCCCCCCWSLFGPGLTGLACLNISRASVFVTIHICYVCYVLVVVPFSRELRKLAYRPQKQTNVWPWVAFVWGNFGVSGFDSLVPASVRVRVRALSVFFGLLFVSLAITFWPPRNNLINSSQLSSLLKHCY